MQYHSSTQSLPLLHHPMATSKAFELAVNIGQKRLQIDERFSESHRLIPQVTLHVLEASKRPPFDSNSSQSAYPGVSATQGERESTRNTLRPFSLVLHPMGSWRSLNDDPRPATNMQTMQVAWTFRRQCTNNHRLPSKLLSFLHCLRDTII